MNDPRLALAAGLATALNAGKPTRAKYVVVPDESAVDTISRRTIIVSLQGFEPLPEAPNVNGLLSVGFIVRVIVPETPIAAAEGPAWDAATDVAFAIESLHELGVTYKSAKKVLHQNRNLAYDLEVESSAKKREA